MDYVRDFPCQSHGRDILRDRKRKSRPLGAVAMLIGLFAAEQFVLLSVILFAVLMYYRAQI